MTEYRGAPQASIQHHYDLSDDFYALWLDESMTYSCALFGSDAESLEEAQTSKLAFFADGIAARGASRVLDVGCGWGSMLKHLVETAEVENVTGITLSKTQAHSIGQWADDRYDVRIENWIDHEPDQPYEAIVSIGAFEHFAKYAMKPEERLESYRDFFRFAERVLVPGGRLGVQTNTKGNNLRPDRETVRDQLFIIERIFPDSELPWLSEVIEASRGMFEPILVRNDGPHYARTCGSWFENLQARRGEAVDLVGEGAVADYERYLLAAKSGFELKHTGLARVLFERVR